jgi:hypothetical protein
MGGFVGLVVLGIVQLERDRGTVYWVTLGTVMEGSVLL